MSGDDAQAVMWLGLAFLFVVGGLGFSYAMWRLGRSLKGLDVELHRTVNEVIPVIAKSGKSVDTVNRQLGKVDLMLDSAVEMTESLDTAVRAVTMAVTEPVKKATGVVAGVSEAIHSFRERVAEPSERSHTNGNGSTDVADDAGDDDGEAQHGSAHGDPDVESVTARIKEQRTKAMKRRAPKFGKKQRDPGDDDYFGSEADES